MKRCAIYTRKSTDEGLEQDFNSLDAQHEACEAFIRSQKHEGWKLVGKRFDDGGFSGGSMDRPALTELLSAIDRGEVDVVVVYKVDRLTRALADFAKIVERFDERSVSFVSVTQHFNTTSSMGRLTLNVLLSFAQFEREVTAERIRDKIAASKKKGMWMGGPPPLGYDIRDKKLIINREEATTVQKLFRLYLEQGTVRDLLREANRLGIVTKYRTHKDGKETGGKLFSRGNLYQLLTNPLYAGQVSHKGEVYPGQHRAIVDEDLWQSVQKQLSTNAVTRNARTNTESTPLLTGLVYDETGDRLCPTHANKAGKRYRYYISKRLIHNADRHEGWRISAEHLESHIVGMISKLLTDDRQLSDTFSPNNTTTQSVKSLLAKAQGMAATLETGGALEKRKTMCSLIERIDLRPDSIAISIRPQAINYTDDTLLRTEGDNQQSPIQIKEVLCLKRRGVETKLILRDSIDKRQNVDERLCQLICNAHSWFQRLASAEAKSIRDLGCQENISETEITRILPLAFLAPDIVEAILAGRQPIEMTATSLRRLSNLPSDWGDQGRLLGL